MQPSMEVTSIAEVPEHDLVDQIWAHDILRHWAFGLFLTGPTDRVQLRVPLEALTEGRARDDVDALVLPQGDLTTQ